LKRTSQRELEIRWSDDFEQRIPFRVLRDACQCARCMDGKNKPDQPVGMLRILTAAETMPIEIASMKPVGNYAYNIEFSDGHSTGLFTFELLRSLK
jgi:DUF971 family protein